MKLKLLLFGFCLLSCYVYTNNEVDIDIFIIIPAPSKGKLFEKVDIGSYFTPNHHSYPVRKSLNHPIFFPQEAFAILRRHSSLFGKVPRGRLLNLHLTINQQPEKPPMYFSLQESNIRKKFTFIPLKNTDKAIEVKLYLIDLNKLAIERPIIEVKIGKSYPIEEVAGKTLFLVIPNTKWVSFQTVDFNKYFFPLEVIYHSP